MKPGFSLWLDFLRAAAALAVLFAHIAHIRFTRGDYYFLREINLGADAVIVFFVISGVVISYAAGRDGSLSRFAFNRVTRLLTVIFPALVLTLVFDAIGSNLDISAYPDPYYLYLEPWKLLLRGLTFSSEWSGLSNRVRLGTNGPLWSLSYEAAYYILFGIALFLRGPLRIVFIALVVFLAGFPVMVLMPTWLMGVLVWRRISNRSHHNMGRGSALRLALLYPAILVVSKISGLPEALSRITANVFAPVSHHDVLYYSDEVLWSMVIGGCVALHIIGMARLLQNTAPDETAKPLRLVRYVAGASFSIYVMHYPTLHLLDATLPETLPGYDAILLILTLMVCFCFAAAFERPLGYYRRLLLSQSTRFRREKTESRQSPQ